MENPDLQFTDFLDPSYQELVLGLAVKDQDFFARARPLILPKYFNSRVLAECCAALNLYWDTYHVLPSPAILPIAVSERTDEPTAREAWADKARTLYEICEDDLDREWIEPKLISFAIRAETARAVVEAAGNSKAFDIDVLNQELRRIQEIPARFGSIGTSLKNDWPTATDRDTRAVFATGLTGFDQAMRGGMKEGELVMFLGVQKGGKSLTLINVGRALMQMGHSVIHYSLEMYQLDVLKRYVASHSRRPTNQLHDHRMDIQKAMDELKQYTDADVIIKEYPGYQVTVDEIDAHLSLAEATYGRKFVPVVDYLSLIQSTLRTDETWKTLPEIAVRLRNMGRRHGVPIVTAHQSSVGGFNAKKLDATHQAGSKQIGANVEYEWSIDQDDDDYKCNRFQMTPFLSRHERKDRTTFWHADYACSYIEEVSETTYEALGKQNTDDDGSVTGHALPEKRAVGGRAA